MVPADTAMYESLVVDNTLAELLAPLHDRLLDMALNRLVDADPATPAPVQRSDTPDPIRKMVSGLLKAYAAALETGAGVPGVAQPLHIVRYSVGAVAVVRLALDDADAFKAFLDRAERLGGVERQNETLQGVTLRVYPLSLPEDPRQHMREILAVRPGALVITFVDDSNAQLLPVILGLQAPATGLADATGLQQLIEANDLSWDNLLVVNQQVLMDRLVRPAETADEADEPTSPEGLFDLLRMAYPALHSPACQADLAQLVSAWPYTIAGLQPGHADDGAPNWQARLVSQLTDEQLVDTLSQLRGHIPAALLDGTVQAPVRLSLGLNMDQAGGVLLALQRRFLQADFQCAFLLQAQQQVKAVDPVARMLPAINMLAGVQGISLAVFDAGNRAESGLAAADFMLVVSAQQPRNVFKLLKNAPGRLIKDSLRLPTDGRAVRLFGDRPGLPPAQAMLVGKQLIVFSGPRATVAAQALADDGQADDRNDSDAALKANGLLAVHADSQALLNLLATFAPIYTNDDDFLDAIRWLQAYTDQDSILDANLDIQPQGLVLDTGLQLVPGDGA